MTITKNKASKPGANSGITPLIANIKNWLDRKQKPETHDNGFSLFASDPFAATHRLLNTYLSELPRRKDYDSVKPQKTPTGRAVLLLEAAKKLQVLRAIMVRVHFWNEAEERKDQQRAQAQQGKSQKEIIDEIVARMLNSQPQPKVEEPLDAQWLGTLAHDILRSQVPLTTTDLADLAGLVRYQFAGIWYPISAEDVLACIERQAAKSPLAPEVLNQLHAWREQIQSRSRIRPEDRKVLDRVKALVSDNADPGVVAGEAWSNAALADYRAMPANRSAAWLRLFQLCQKAESSKPTQKWEKAARELIKEIGDDAFRSHVVRWFDLVALPRPVHQEPRSRWQPDPDLLINDDNAIILRGLAWCCAGSSDPAVSRALSNLAEVCFKKVRNLGPRCPKVGNACLHSLSITTTDSAAAQLSRLDATVKQPTAKKRINKSLNTAAELTGQSREDLEEKSVPTFDLNQKSQLTRTLGECQADIRIANGHTVEVVWSKAGKVLKSAPASLKQSHAAQFKEFQKLIKEIEKMLAAHRIRIERLLMTEREWEFESWRQRYLNQPLLAPITRRLIWHFKSGTRTGMAIWFEGKLVDVKNRPLDWLGPETRVRLWHPIGFDAETVVSWRRWLETHEVVQPFKQAHREIYVITDAELKTEDYSNRFAAHVIRQHQFAAIAKQRAWTYSLMGSFDFQSTPTLALPAWNLEAEFLVQPMAEAAGVSPYLSTDQVRFVRGEHEVPLHDVPATVFSEVMRDVDLFIGVCSIGNDPAWRDQDETANRYWHEYSFGKLSASAEMRRDLLERLLPKLKIAKQCSLQGKFLVVRGHRRTYKIHLGSGNILMEPNDQYLCIVPDAVKAARSEVFLPFEGDFILATILSKAFLLANDEAITDKSIVSQIRK